MASPAVHIVLLGDSIFDNGTYVPGRPSVHDQLMAKTSERGWRCTLLAVDGNVINDVGRQLKGMPEDATHLFISVGGNNGLRYMSHLTAEVKTLGDALLLMSKLREKFHTDYSEMIGKLLALKLPTTVCSIYNPRFPAAREQTICETGLCFLNDVIFSVAAKHSLPVIDLRTICCEPEDYANAIEPSVHGGDKISDNVVHVVATHNFSGPSVLYTMGFKKAGGQQSSPK